MNLLPGTEKYLDEVERYTGTRFQHRSEIGFLLESAARGGKSETLEKSMFLAKFIQKGFEILRRSGHDSDETRALAGEVERNLAELIGLLRGLCTTDREASLQLYGRDVFARPEESLEIVHGLLPELTLLKNYQLDGHAIPYPSFGPR